MEPMEPPPGSALVGARSGGGKERWGGVGWEGGGVGWGGEVVHQGGQHGAAGPVLVRSFLYLAPYDSSHCPMKRTTLLQICIVSVIAEAVVLCTCKMVV